MLVDGQEFLSKSLIQVVSTTCSKFENMNLHQKIWYNLMKSIGLKQIDEKRISNR